MFKVPESRRNTDANRFQFELDGQAYNVPLLQFAPVEAAELLEDGKTVAAFLAMCENDAARDAVRGLDGEQFGALAQAWADASEVSPGESAASSD